MMRRTVLGLVLVATTCLTGCGGCNSETPAPPAAAPTKAPAAATPAANAAPAAAAPKAENAPAVPPATGGQADCFVIVDAEPDFGAPPLAVKFTTEIDCTGAPVTYSWDFGDGTKGGNEADPSHTYAKAGDYVAVVTATSPDGGVGSDEIDITVDDELAE